MARRRHQQPKAFRDGNFWVIRPREDALNENGERGRTRRRYVLGPCVGVDKLTERQANEVARDTVLKTINNFVACPSSVITVEKFIDQKFTPEWVNVLKKAGKEFYSYCLKQMVKPCGCKLPAAVLRCQKCPSLGRLRLCDVTPSDIRMLVSQLEKRGLSGKTQSHVKTAAATLFNFAKQEKFFHGDNPAEQVRMGEIASPERYAYSFLEAQQVLGALDPMPSDMCFCSMTTSMNVAELCGLKWKRVNLTDKVRWSAGEAIPPFSALVRENYYRNEWGSVKTKKRRRTVGLPDYVVERLLKLQQTSKFTKDDDPVFASRTGNPIDAHNTNSRHFKHVSRALSGIPITWHIFRHSAATFCEALNMPLADREKLLGHANGAMTMHYTHSDVERRRVAQNEMAEQLVPARERMMRKLMKASVEGPKQ